MARGDGSSTSELGIQSFLKLGYFIDDTRDQLPIDFSRIDRDAYREHSDEELVEHGLRVLRESFQALWSPGRDNVVPLSGGLDSRLILGQLLEFSEAKQLRTYTYGVPGSYDFEIGCQVAKHFGTRHAVLPLNEFPYHEDELFELARRTGARVQLFHSAPLREVDRLCSGAQVWSGYLGDLVAGSHVHGSASPTLAAAQRLYLYNRAFVRSTRLHSASDEELVPHVGSVGLDPARMTYDEQVIYGEVAVKFTGPAILYQGLNFKTPLVNSPWMDFMSSVPDRVRFGEELMLRIANRAFPELFALPSKNTLGLKPPARRELIALKKWVNKGKKLIHQFLPQVGYPLVLYNDFNEAFRENRSFQRLVRDKIRKLSERGLVRRADMDELLRRHLARRRNHGDALVVLASLEILLQCREQGN